MSHETMKPTGKLTKKEFAEYLNLKYQSRVSTLLKQGKIEQTSDGLIDLQNPKNAAYLELRKITVPLYTTGIVEADEVVGKEPSTEEPEKNEVDLFLAKERLRRIKLSNEMLEIKQRKEIGELVELTVLQDCIHSSFNTLLNTLLEYPSSIAPDLVDIVHTSEAPLQSIVGVLEKGLRTQITAALQNAKESLKAINDKSPL